MIQHILTEGRRFGRTNIRESFEVLFDSGYTIKAPAIPLVGKRTPAEKAQAVCDWYLDKLGSNSQKVRDMWWVKQENKNAKDEKEATKV
eukprot:CAMPEP_0116855472 /NCGR_PEP_ID=MMETSP0418-20121206/19300_1 /TAXON_ID=1158023 /ORGANISM="Astrosyne radiata, Strain 13vi08-1A" /LENGTH=88 /DNA_ID=CAMNT_0004488615 /DNA_START=18 /DNA_END=284 /DNA_ORIENTATION=-